MQARVKHSLDRIQYVSYVENKERPSLPLQKHIKLRLVTPFHSRELSSKEVMCCSLATD